MANHLLKFLFILVFSIMITLGIIYLVGVEKITKELMKMDLILFFLASLSYLMVNIVMALRIKYVLEKLNEKPTLKDCFKSNMFGMLLSDITIARTGYFGTAIDLSAKTGIALEKTFVAIFLPQMIDFIIKVLSSVILINLVIINLGLLSNEQLFSFTLLSLFFLLLFFSILTIMLEKSMIEKLSFLAKIPILNKFYVLAKLVVEYSALLKLHVFKVSSFTIIAWLFKGLEWYFLALAFGINIFGIFDYLFFLLFQPLVTFSHFLPIPTVGGTGLSEGLVGLILNAFGISLEIAIAYGFMTRFLMLIINLLFGVNRLLEIIMMNEFTKMLESINNIIKKTQK
ncbi:MAG: lysylphosphatidylglycerol synthase transmembrane domain-containing protein [Candidatus Anstonellales archaeon]